MADIRLKARALARANATGRAWERSDTTLGRARETMRRDRWIPLLLIVLPWGTYAIWFADWPILAGALFLGTAVLLAFGAAALTWHGTVRWRKNLLGMIGSVVATAVVCLGPLVGASFLLEFYRDPTVRSSPPRIPAPWPVSIGLAVVFAGLFLSSGRRSRSG